MARHRTFIAIDVGKELRSSCVAMQETLGQAGADVKWVEEENLHVTLLFLGEVDDRTLAKLCRIVATVAEERSSFFLHLAEVGCFPNTRRPRVVWAGVGSGTAEIVDLHDALEPPLQELGCYRREERRFVPHITLGRVRGEAMVEQLSAAIAKQENWQGGGVEVREILVLSSELTRDGPSYTVLGRGKLRGGRK